MKQHMIINIRGASGSGKSHIIHRLIDKGATPLIDKRGKIWAYGLDYPGTYILGRYESSGGGCDMIRGIDRLTSQILRLAEIGNVIFEGRAASVTSARWIDLAESAPQYKWLFIALNTSAEDCVRGISKRRVKRGVMKTPKAKNIIRDTQAVNRTSDSLLNAGLDIQVLNREEAYNKVRDILGLR